MYDNLIFRSEMERFLQSKEDYELICCSKNEDFTTGIFRLIILNSNYFELPENPMCYSVMQ